MVKAKNAGVSTLHPGIFIIKPRDWINADKLLSRDFICGHCGKDISSSHGYTSSDDYAKIYICHRCDQPTFIDGSKQVPGGLPARSVDKLPPDVEALWTESRYAYTVQAWTLVIMGCRKMLMNISVAKGAPEGLNFVNYVDWLNSEKYIPPGSSTLLTEIKDFGNKANHKIIPRQPEEADRFLTFLEMLLVFMFQYSGEVAPGDQAQNV